MASSHYAEVFATLDNLSISIHESSLTKTGYPEGEGHYDRKR